MPASRRKFPISFPAEYTRDFWWKCGNNISLQVLRSSPTSINALKIHKSHQRREKVLQVFWDVKTCPLVSERHTASIFTADHAPSLNIYMLQTAHTTYLTATSTLPNLQFAKDHQQFGINKWRKISSSAERLTASNEGLFCEIAESRFHARCDRFIREREVGAM
jgi:hypothetical protein